MTANAMKTVKIISKLPISRTPNKFYFIHEDDIYTVPLNAHQKHEYKFE